MKKNHFLFVILFSPLLWIACNRIELVKQTEISENWQFRQVGKEEWKSAVVPGTVHQDLLKHGIIQDPFFGLNEFDVQWIENENWEYKTTFSVSDDQFSQNQKELIFKGLDTYADVYLNDSLILVSDNMFRSWEVDCTPIIKKGENELRILFKSPVKIGLEKLNELGYLIPVQNEQAPKGKQTSTLTRKAAYHYGWDWGPRLVTSGVWQSIYLKTWSTAKINDTYQEQKSLTKEKAVYNSNIEIIADKELEASVKIELDGKKVKEEKVKLTPGLNSFSLPYSIDNPELWWSVGLGNAKLYEVKTTISVEGNTLDVKISKMGVRSLKIIQTPDAIGKSFYVELNGVPVFIKGANYIPGDNLIPRVGKDNYQRVIEETLAANMNALRVWGGAIYETDYFYNLCAEKGIILYQDFMFACSLYPAGQEIAENIRLEAEEQVKRLRNYPNIMLWAGNNEVLNAWHEWDFQERFGYNNVQKDTLWSYYSRIFYEILPNAVKKYDPEKLYWSCSPQSEHGVLQNHLSGDQHFWTVWFGEKPFTEYEQQPGRFISEYGFQSYPCMNTLRKMMKEEDIKLFSEVLNKRQRSPMEWLGEGKNGNHMMDIYMKKEFKDPKDMESYVYVSQLLQAQAVQKASEAHRRNMPYTMGSMYWQINDCWPTISWSSIDYYGNWKASHYQVRKSYEKVLVSFREQNGKLKVFVVSDKTQKISGKLRLTVSDFKGEVLSSKTYIAEVPANSSAVYIEETVSDLLKGRKKEEVFVHAEFFGEDDLLIDNRYFFVPMKSLALTNPKIETTLTNESGHYFIEVTTDVFAKNMYISFDGVDINLSDNFFDLNAKGKKKLSFKIENTSLDELKAKMKILTLANSY